MPRPTNALLYRALLFSLAGYYPLRRIVVKIKFGVKNNFIALRLAQRPPKPGENTCIPIPASPSFFSAAPAICRCARSFPGAIRGASLEDAVRDRQDRRGSPPCGGSGRLFGMGQGAREAARGEGRGRHVRQRHLAQLHRAHRLREAGPQPRRGLRTVARHGGRTVGHQDVLPRNRSVAV